MVDSCNLGEVLLLCTVLLHVLAAGVAEHLWCTGSVGYATGSLHHFCRGTGWVRAVVEEGLKGAWEHLLESNNQYCVCHAAGDHCSTEMKASGSSTACNVGRRVSKWFLHHKFALSEENTPLVHFSV